MLNYSVQVYYHYLLNAMEMNKIEKLRYFYYFCTL